MVWTRVYPEAVDLPDGCVLAIGNFDGVHAGHRALLGRARVLAEGRGLPLVVLTFEPHPRSVLRPHEPLVRLTGAEEKAVRLGDCGVDGVAVLPFDMNVAGWSPAEFIERAVAGWLGARVVCVGENFRYGHKAQGDVAALRADGRFGVEVVELVRDAGGVVSSSRLRGTD